MKYLDIFPTEIPNLCAKSRSLRLSRNFISVKKIWLTLEQPMTAIDLIN